MQETYVFCHGWGVDHHFWDPIKPYFSLKKCIYLDLGYFGKQNLSITKTNNEEFIGVAHSLGLTKLLNLRIKFKAIIGIQSFINFLGYDILLKQQRKYELETLEKFFLIQPKNCLSCFYNTNKLQIMKFNKTYMNTKLLYGDLKLLYNNFILPTQLPLLIIGALNDLVVPIKLIADNFAKHDNINFITYHDGNHNLCLNYSRNIFNDINNFVNYILK